MQIITNQFQKELKQHGNEQFPFLVSYQKLSEYESGSFMWHWHPEIEITYVQKGTMCYKVNHMVYHLKEGDIVFNNSGALHSGTMENQKDCAYIPVTFDSRLIYGFFQSTVNSKYVDPVIQDSMLPAICIDQSEPWHKPFREYLLRIIDLDEKKPDFYELDITICLQSIWRLLLEHITYEPQASRENSLEYDRIKKILSYIEENYQNKITLNDIAGHIHLCESECTRLFKRHMNTTLFAFLQEYRIERSLEFLQADLPVSAVADKAGFSDPNYYSKVFAKIKGCSPREYRKHRL
ncbi:AraC family transcriptional regulator [Ruminococcus sp. 1001136sp1]|uniref:AraC family transcriptional regulator n=1 Tax=unclassified Ruminococcus TaxID=2608920 RepID=UPI00189E2100|nr:MULTISPECIES: AraC family transcriptional regulator [unclassified Ruminococcus]MDB8770876.1 AraC family transcriptional regulator [Ruminococcus sp. 1001136sp1]MDB8782914.1 AraC family transcriptional regulator [Ruminococcus sp. 1001136sp1]